MKAYLDIVKNILDNGLQKEDKRTGTDTIMLPGLTFKHDMAEGFPAVTTKKLYFHGAKVEMEFFIKGITDKNWLRARRTTIWDEWSRRDNFPEYDVSKEGLIDVVKELRTLYEKEPHHEKGYVKLKKKIAEVDEILKNMGENVTGGQEDVSKLQNKEKEFADHLRSDLGPVYGFQWRNLGAKYIDHKTDYTGQGKDQLAKLVNTLKTNPTDRGMIVMSWNPLDEHMMALRPCHLYYQVTVAENKLNLDWVQRSVDVGLGLPFNIAGYGVLLHLLAKESGFEEGILTGHLVDTHIYENHIGMLTEQVKREPKTLPQLETSNFTSIFDWKYQDTKLVGYKYHPIIKMEVSV